jgi:hypothetical protein
MIYHNIASLVGFGKHGTPALLRYGCDAMITPLNKPPFLVEKHAKSGAKFIYAPSETIVFGIGVEEVVSHLAMMQTIENTQPNQCILLIKWEERSAVYDTVNLWNNFGGTSLPIIHSLENTLSMIEEELLSGISPGSWASRI